MFCVCGPVACASASMHARVCECVECVLCVCGRASEPVFVYVRAPALNLRPPPLRCAHSACGVSGWFFVGSDLNRDSRVATAASLAAKLEHARRHITHGSVSDHEPFVAPVFAVIHSPYPAPPQNHLNSRRSMVQSVGPRAGKGREGGGVLARLEVENWGWLLKSLGHPPPQARQCHLRL